MKVKVGVSNRHVHLTLEDLNILFGNIELTKRNDLNQPGQFAANEVVSIEGPKSSIDNVRILGPVRKYTQVEVSKTDSYKLGIDPPIRESGDLNGASLIKIIGPKGTIERESCIIANRHIHVDDTILEKQGLKGINKVSVRVGGEKGAILENVYLKNIPNSYFEMHIDTDDANACLLKQDMEVEILLDK